MNDENDKSFIIPVCPLPAGCELLEATWTKVVYRTKEGDIVCFEWPYFQG
jgi:hypothetical protein